MSTFKMTFSLASLVLIFAFAFVAMPAMAVYLAVIQELNPVMVAWSSRN